MTEMTPAERLDDVDRRIVAALQADPRAPWAQLGALVGVSETTVMRRVQRLRDTGSLIVLAAPDPLRCGLGQPVHVYFQTFPGRAGQVAHQLAQRADVRYVSLLAGSQDVMCELIAPDHRYLRNVLLGELTDEGAVRSSTTAVVLKQFKISDQWSDALLHPGREVPRQAQPEPEPAPDKPLRLDELDSQLLAALGSDGRRSYADLSADLGISETTVARRLAALTAARRVYFLALVDPSAVGYDLEAILHFRVEASTLDSVAATLMATSQVRYIAATTGTSDLTCDAVFRDTDDLYDFLTRTVAGVRGVLHVDVDVVLESVKRQYHYPLFGAGTRPSPRPAKGRARPASDDPSA
jgi:DNA-binding Lrp family transcriptional regulator